ncbi:PilZ domain-containing protein [Sulfurospirillum arcachonense]|uniref:PilZ domain-containing protein n=1 Tax=Sulfurospirillum arcachonense TaxID=57666 RepID=UPI000468B5BA|nr:PilZ domain-containing protein [Sulfurospirillum arcachonense]
MNNEELKMLLRNVHFAHLYVDTIVFSGLEKNKDYFLEYKSFNLNDTSLDIKSSDIVFIELKELNKETFKLLNNIVKTNVSKEIYIFSPKEENIFLLKFALHFSLNKINSISIKEEEINKILYEAARKIERKKEDKIQLEVSKKVNSFFSLLIFNKDRLIFANEKSKELFDSQDSSEIENLIKNHDEINTLLSKNKNDKAEIIIEYDDGEKWNYGFFLDLFSNNDDKLLTIIPLNKVKETDAFMDTINKFKFIEILKDKLAQNSISNKPMALVNIDIKNYDRLKEATSSAIVHEFIKKFINKLSSYKDSSQDLVQWNAHCFIFLMEKSTFEQVKLKLDTIHQKLIYNEIDKNVPPIITSSALSIERLDINDIINCIEQINHHAFTCSDFNSDDFFEINHLNNYLDEDEQIKHYLESCVSNKTPLKLLNIYKGLCLNTTSSVIKVQANTYFLRCENLQGYSMKFENKTIIQAPDLQKDIRADVVYVNLEESYVVLDNLVFLDSSANNREHTRVQPRLRTPITIKYKRYSYQGEIIDLSTQAVAIMLNHSLSDELVSEKVEIQFKLPDSSNENGFAYMDVTGEIVHVGEIDITKSKIVVMVDLEKPYDSYLLKYMYERQKELIFELKKAIKLMSK